MKENDRRFIEQAAIAFHAALLTNDQEPDEENSLTSNPRQTAMMARAHAEELFEELENPTPDEDEDQGAEVEYEESAD